MRKKLIHIILIIIGILIISSFVSAAGNIISCSDLNSILSDVNINLVLENVPNPVLSKLKVNIEDRYKL